MNRFQHDNLEMTAKRRAWGMYNGKPYRTKAQKYDARHFATKRDDGAFRSTAPVSMHPIPRTAG